MYRRQVQINARAGRCIRAVEERSARTTSGQSAAQQSKERAECQVWASSRKGFNPTVAGGGVALDQAVNKRNDYFRARVSCLEGRGYTVR